MSATPIPFVNNYFHIVMLLLLKRLLLRKRGLRAEWQSVRINYVKRGGNGEVV